MPLIAPDFGRRIELPGVGPCPRPVDIDQSVTGFSDLVSLRIYSFDAGSAINGEAEGDEVYIVLIGGAARLSVSGPAEAEFELTETGTRAAYLPPDHHYRLEPQFRADIAYVRAKPQRPKNPAGFQTAASGTLLPDPGHADRLHMTLVALSGTRPVTLSGTGSERLVFSTVKATFQAGDETESGAAWATLATTAPGPVTISGDEQGLALLVSA